MTCKLKSHLVCYKRSSYSARQFGKFSPCFPWDSYPTIAPGRSWKKPIVVLMNNHSYSNAEMFPYGMRAAGLAKLVGTPPPGYVIWTSGWSLVDGTSARMPGQRRLPRGRLAHGRHGRAARRPRPPHQRRLASPTRPTTRKGHLHPDEQVGGKISGARKRPQTLQISTARRSDFLGSRVGKHLCLPGTLAV
jgi:hypothetical protein